MARGGSIATQAAATVVWAVLLLALWIALTDNTRPWELVAGAACALAAAAMLRAVAAGAGLRLAVRRAWVTRCLAAPWWAVRDSALVLRAVVTRRPAAGRMRAVPFEASGHQPLDRGRRALVLGAGSAGPNQYAVTESGEDEVLVVHELVPAAEVTAAGIVREP